MSSLQTNPPVGHTDLTKFKHESLLDGHLIAGLYCLLDSGKIVYIGQSANILGRLAQHRRARQHTFTDALFFPLEDTSERLRHEAVLILLYHPPGNRAIMLGLGNGKKVWEIKYKKAGTARKRTLKAR